MAINLAQISIFGVLLSFLVVGFMYKKRPQTIKEYALGKGKISTPTLMATMVATMIGGGSLLGMPAALYKNGLWFFVAMLSMPIGNCLISLVIIPKLSRYYGYLSIAEIIGKIYGKYARKVVGISAFLFCLGILGAQIKAFHWVMQSLFSDKALIATIVGLSIIIAYSSMGGVSSVIKTDVLQFFIFAVIVPLIAGYIIKISGGITEIADTFSKSNRDFFYGGSITAFISLFIYNLLPHLIPSSFHRFLVGRDTEKNKVTAYTLALVNLISLIFAGCIAFIAITNFTDLKPQNTLFAVVEHFALSKWAIVFLQIALIAIIVSTADSLVNTGAITFTHDILSQKISEEKKIKLLRSVTILSGVVALAFACFFPGILDIVIFVSEYYLIIITVPFISGLFIKHKKKEPFWSSVILGAATFTILHLIYRNLSHEIFIISMLMSLVGYISTYIFVSKKTTSLHFFSVSKLCDKIIGKQGIQKAYLGFIALFFFVSAIILRNSYYHSQLKELIAMEASAGLLGFLLFFADKFSKKYSNIISLFIIWYCFSFFPAYIFLHQEIGNFSTISFVISIGLLAILFSWNVFLTFLLSGSFFAVLSYFLFGHNIANFLGRLIQLCLLLSCAFIVAYILFERKELGILSYIKKKFKIPENIDQKIRNSEVYNKILPAIRDSFNAEDRFKHILLLYNNTKIIFFDNLKEDIYAYFREISIKYDVEISVIDLSNVGHNYLHTGISASLFYRITYSLILNAIYCWPGGKIQVKFCCDNDGGVKAIEIIHSYNSYKMSSKMEEVDSMPFPEEVLPWITLQTILALRDIKIIDSKSKLKIKFPYKSSSEEDNVVSFEELVRSDSSES